MLLNLSKTVTDCKIDRRKYVLVFHFIISTYEHKHVQTESLSMVNFLRKNGCEICIIESSTITQFSTKNEI